MEQRVRKRKVIKKKAWLGIDPGKSGAACLIVDDGEILFMDWPKSNDPTEVWKIIRGWKSLYDMRGLLERSQPMRKPGERPQGVVSVFSYGTNFGIWVGFLIALGIPRQLESPRKWQGGVGIVKSDGPTPKARAQVVVTRLYPKVNSLFGPRGGYKDGRGDALLMAHYLKGLGG